MKRFLIFFFCIICIPEIGSSQTPGSGFTYSPLVINAGYRCPLKNNSILNSGHGAYAEAGFNPGYYLRHKRLFCIFGGWAGKDRFWNTSFNNRFLADFNSSMKDIIFSPADSAIISSFREAVNRKGSSSFSLCPSSSFHNSSFYYGILFRLPFKKYDSFIKLYQGRTQSSCTVDDGEDSGRIFYFGIRRKMMGAELVLFPGFAKQLKEKAGNSSLEGHLAAISFYYEQCNFSRSQLYFTDEDQVRTISFRDFLTPSFLEKYKTESSFGLRLSVGLY